jgi:hypothetical protein
MSKNNKDLNAKKLRKRPTESSRERSSIDRDGLISNLNPWNDLSCALDAYRNIGSFTNPFRDLTFRIQQSNLRNINWPEAKRTAQLQQEFKHQMEMYDWTLQLQKISQLPERFVILNANKSFLSMKSISEPVYLDMLEAVRMSDKLQLIVANTVFIDSSLSASIQQIEQMNLYISLPATEKIQIYAKWLPDILQAIRPLQDFHDKINLLAAQANQVRDYVGVADCESEEESSFAQEFETDLDALPVYLEAKAAVFERLYYNFRQEAQATIDDLWRDLAYVKEENVYLRDNAAFLMDEVKRLQYVLDEIDGYFSRGQQSADE